MKHYLKFFWVLSVLFGSLTSSALAQVDEMDAAFDFEEESSSVNLDALTKETSQKPSDFSQDGFLRFDGTYAYGQETKRVAKLRTTANVGLKYKFAGAWQSRLVVNATQDAASKINENDTYTDSELAAQSEFEIRDAFVEGPLSQNWRIKSGRQILAWGQSDVLQINDVVNPRDQRELGMVELEDARIPVASTLLQWVKDAWEVSLVGIHEFRPNKMAAQGSPYDRFAALKAQGILLNEEELPANGSEAVLRVFKSMNGGDVAFYSGQTYGDSFYLDFANLDFSTGIPSLSLTPKYKKIPFVGFAGNKVSGSWLFKAEFAKKTGVPQRQKDVSQQVVSVMKAIQSQKMTPDSAVIQSYQSKDLHQMMLGFEYSGITDLSISAEVVLEQIQNYETRLASREVGGTTFVMMRHSALNETLKTSLSLINLLNQNGTVSKLGTAYSDWKEAVTVSGGIVIYSVNNEEALLKPLDKNDRLFASMKYSF